jgi:F0F1-type ATP synthase membrane subunit b/b'
MSNRLEPEIIQVIEEIVTRRLREVLEERAKLVSIDHFAEAMERIDKRFEESQKRFEEIQKRFEESDKKSDKRFEALQKEMRQGFEETQKRFEESDKKSDRMLDILNNLQTQLGKPFEQFARNVIIRILEGEGISNVLLKSRKIKDKNRFVFPDGTDEIEIDGLSEEPPSIIEITSILRNMDKVNTFLRKKEFVEKKFEKKFRGFFISAGSELSQQEIADITVLLRKCQSELINL